MRQSERKQSGQEGALVLSAIELHPRDSEFQARLAPYPGDEAFAAIKQDATVFAYRRSRAEEQEQLLLVPLVTPAEPAIEGATRSLRVSEHLSPIARLIQQRLPALCPNLLLEATHWSLLRTDHRQDLISKAFTDAELVRPKRLSALRKFNRIEFKVRHEYLPGRGRVLLLTLEFDRAFVIEGSTLELVHHGFRLDGLDVYQPGKPRRWATVRGRDGDRLQIVEPTGEAMVDAKEWFLEASAPAFQTLFEQALGRLDFERYERAEWILRAKTHAGHGYVSRVAEWVRYFKNRGELAIAPSLKVSALDVVSLPKTGRSAPATVLNPTEYCFSADRGVTHHLPYLGIPKYGPFDDRTFTVKEPRLLVLCPREARQDVGSFVRRLLNGLGTEGGTRRFAKGMAETYCLRKVTPLFAVIDLPESSERIGPRYVDAVKDVFDPARRPDLALVVVRDEDAFVAVDNPYLAAKAFLLGQGIPSQEMRLSKIRAQRSDLPFILEDVSLAMYAKLGGIPWTVQPSTPLTKEVILGMAWAEFGERHAPGRRFMGVTTVFSSSGTYLLAAGSPRCTFDEYPTMLAESVRGLLARLCKDEGWGEGDKVRLVFHAPKPLTGKEIDALIEIALKALGTKVKFESAFLTIEKDHPYKVVDTQAQGERRYVELAGGGYGHVQVAECVPERGTVVDLGRGKRLLCVNGPLLARREGESIPQPLQLELHRASTYTDLDALTRQVFHFTGLSWRSMRPITEPVTLAYSRWIAALLGRLDQHPGWKDDLLDTHLRTSRWFL